MDARVESFDDLLRAASGVARKRVLVVNPANTETFRGIAEAAGSLPASFLLVGNPGAIRDGLETASLDPSQIEIFDAASKGRAVELSIAMARDGMADVLMKGSVDTVTLMRAVLHEASGVRAGGLLSDIFVFEYPRRERNRLVMITDGGITAVQDLKTKVELIRNAVTVAHALGNAEPRVAVLSSTEFVQPALQSTVEAAALSKMNERGQITGCIVDGPLALDNAISPAAAAEKGIRSPVAGQADILLASSIESANALAKSTTYFAGYRLAHVVVGAKIPVLIPSRADSGDARLLSVALGMYMAEHPRASVR
jgi:phosphate butyryltransferase